MQTLGPATRIIVFLAAVMFTVVAALDAVGQDWWGALGYAVASGVCFFGAATGRELDNPDGERGSFHLWPPRSRLSRRQERTLPPNGDAPPTTRKDSKGSA